MREFQRKRPLKRILYTPVSIVVLLALLSLIGRATWNMYGKERESRKQLERATVELAAFEAREKELTERIARLKTQEGIEAEIRGQFPVTKPGERMVVIVEEKANETEEVIRKQSLISKFVNLFR